MSKTPEELAAHACRPLTKGAGYGTQALIGALAGGAGGALSGFMSADDGEVGKTMLRHGLVGAAAGGLGAPLISRALNANARPAAKQPPAKPAPHGPKTKSKPVARTGPKTKSAPAQPAPPAAPEVAQLKTPERRTDLQDTGRNLFILGHNLANMGESPTRIPWSDPSQDLGLGPLDPGPARAATAGVVAGGAGYTGSRINQARNDVSVSGLLKKKDVIAVPKVLPGLKEELGPSGPGIVIDSVRNTKKKMFPSSQRQAFRDTLVDESLRVGRAHDSATIAFTAAQNAAAAARAQADSAAAAVGRASALDKQQAIQQAEHAESLAKAKETVAANAKKALDAEPTPPGPAGSPGRRWSEAELRTAAERNIDSVKSVTPKPGGEYEPVTTAVTDARHAKAMKAGKRLGIGAALISAALDTGRSYNEARDVINQSAKQ